ncbi:MAG: hypothetical protein ACM3O8_14430 [Methylococcaceae bacterium]|nr:hypothetical protein [Prolixibacteraceae bacterium]
MKVLIYWLFILLLLLSACKKDDEPGTSFLAGIYDDSMNYREINPGLQISFKYDSLLNVNYGKDSLDINLDGSYDIIISQRNLLGNPTENTNRNNTYPYMMLGVKNGVEVAIKNECFIIGHGQYSTISWVDTIAYKTNVAGITNWSESNRIVYMWVEPPSIFRPSNGPWYNLANTERYVAFRMGINSQYRYGWIKFIVASHEKITVISYALEKKIGNSDSKY